MSPPASIRGVCAGGRIYTEVGGFGFSFVPFRRKCARRIDPQYNFEIFSTVGSTKWQKIDFYDSTCFVTSRKDPLVFVDRSRLISRD